MLISQSRNQIALGILILLISGIYLYHGLRDDNQLQATLNYQLTESGLQHELSAEAPLNIKSETAIEISITAVDAEEEAIYRNFVVAFNSEDPTDISTFLNRALQHPAHLLNDIEQFRKALIELDYEMLQELVHRFVGTEYEQKALRAALDMAVSGRNIDLIEFLTNIGADVTPSHLRSAIFSHDDAFITALQNVGVDLIDIDAKNHGGASALSYLIYCSMNISGEYNPIFDRLLMAGYNPSEEKYGVDPLSLSIRYFKLAGAGNAQLYAKKLISNGANITPRHLNMMMSIKDSHPKLYDDVVEQIPELKTPNAMTHSR